MKLNEVQLANNVNHKALKVLKILLLGRSVKLGEHEVYLVETEGSYRVITTFTDNRIIGLNYSLESFLAWAEEVSNDEIFVKLGEIAIQDENKRNT